MKHLIRFLTSRTGKTVLLLAVEAFWLFSLIKWLTPYIGWLEAVIRILSVFLVFYIVNFSQHLSSDLMWVILIMFFPVAGTFLYFFLNGLNHFSSKTYGKIADETKRAALFYEQDKSVLETACRIAPDHGGLFKYVSGSGFPLYENTGFDYYALGEEGFPVMLEEMEKAEKFIFLEYFIIEKGKMWNRMLRILKKKAAEGVDCRVLYDDMGSWNTLPYKYANELEKMGIHAQAFNRVSPILNGIMNHRDHRKILVIDGKVAFSGGINLADEYINEKPRFGVWKDNCFRVTGEAVYSFTLMFLTNWNALRPQDKDYSVYKAAPADERKGRRDGYIAPYGETPLDDQLLGEGVYINILYQAQRYCYIYTPYLIIDEDMSNALVLAAQRGVDVRIITPGIPDKKLVWNITRSYYGQLLKSGVRIFEYTPGFVHAKVFVSDDVIATVGTLNLDYRSLYLHFENGTLLYGSAEIPEIRNDFLKSVSESQEIRKENFRPHPLRAAFFSFIRLFAPMM